MAMLEIKDLRKGYRAPDGSVQPVLHIPSFALGADQQVGLQGTSGSGKTTLLHCIAGILRADQGSIRVDGTEITALSEAQRDAFRARTLGYVFQSFHLLPAHTALENVVLGMLFGPGPDPALAKGLLEKLGLGDRLHYRPPQLSIGQQQRVALARALANRPKLVLADEPTGNLDAARTDEAVTLIQSLCKEAGAALLLVSHDPAVLARFDTVHSLAELNQAGVAEPAP